MAQGILNPFMTAVWTLSNARACSRANQSKTSEFARTVMKGLRSLSEATVQNDLKNLFPGNNIIWAGIPPVKATTFPLAFPGMDRSHVFMAGPYMLMFSILTASFLRTF